MHSQVPRPRIPSKWRLLLSAAALAAIRTSLLELPPSQTNPLPHQVLALQVQFALLLELPQSQTDPLPHQAEAALPALPPQQAALPALPPQLELPLSQTNPLPHQVLTAQVQSALLAFLLQLELSPLMFLLLQVQSALLAPRPQPEGTSGHSLAPPHVQLWQRQHRAPSRSCKDPRAAPKRVGRTYPSGIRSIHAFESKHRHGLPLLALLSLLCSVAVRER